MKKVFLILIMIVCFSLVNGINSANAVQSDTTVITYTCPEGCSIIYKGVGGNSWEVMSATCINLYGESCGDPVVNVVVTENAISPVTPVVNPTALKPNKTDKVNAKKSKKVSARSAETPRMVKKIVYEQIVEEDEE